MSFLQAMQLAAVPADVQAGLLADQVAQRGDPARSEGTPRAKDTRTSRQPGFCLMYSVWKSQHTRLSLALYLPSFPSFEQTRVSGACSDLVSQTIGEAFCGSMGHGHAGVQWLVTEYQAFEF